MEVCYLRTLLILTLSIQLFTNVQARLPKIQSWSKQQAPVDRSGPDGTYKSTYSSNNPNSGPTDDFGAKRGVKADGYGFPSPKRSPLGSIGSRHSPSAATKQRTENPASPGRSYSNGLGNMGSPSLSSTPMFGDLGKLLSPGLTARFGSGSNPFIPQSSSPSTGDRRPNPANTDPDARYLPPGLGSLNDFERKHSAPQSAPSQPQSPHGRQMQPGRSPQRSLYGNPSGRFQNRRYIESDGTETTPEKIYENIIKILAKTPVSMRPTAVVNVVGLNNKVTKARVLLDSGAQITYINSDVIGRLDLSKPHLESEESLVSGTGGIDKSTHKTKLNLCSRFSDFCLPITGAITGRDFGKTPILDTKAIQRYNDVELAEDETLQHESIDILVSVEYFEQIFLHKVKPRLTEGFPPLYKTNFGWMTFGTGIPGFKYTMFPPKTEADLAAKRRELGLD